MSCDCDYICSREAVQEQHYSNCSTRQQRSPDGRVTLKNDHLQNLDEDVLYHFNITTNDDLPARFGDVKFVCIGGTDHRMHTFATYMAGILGLEVGDNLTESSRRFAMYKVGPVLAVSHGIGIPSMITCLQELLKLLYYAKAKDPVMIRIGSSGGLTIPGGSVVVSTSGLSGMLRNTYEVPVLGNMRSYPTFLDKRLAEELIHLSKNIVDFKVVEGVTMSADDFYRGQARLDGPFCDYKESDKENFLKQLVALGVKNIEMEATAFSALTLEAGVRAAIVCVTFLNRLEGDQVTTPKSTLIEWENRPMLVVSNLILKYLRK